jgi:acetylornithine deacetylase/succinyl-diaminopimelate desuccinylase-like protein
LPIELLHNVQSEISRLLSELIQINTTNPPGNEAIAANWLAQNLKDEGFDCEIYESNKSRGNLITRLTGTGGKPRLLLLSHLDVVGATPKEWSVDPFAGIIKDGFVWGRGTLDMKGMTAIEVMTLKLLKRDNVKLKGDVLLAATADEEMGGIGGVDFLLRNHKEKIFAEYVINEGGGSSISTHGRNIYTVSTAEKGLLWLKVRAKGVPGHGSMPDSADNAILRMNQVVNHVSSIRGKIELAPEVKQFISSLPVEDQNIRDLLGKILEFPQDADSIIDELEKVAPGIADEIRPRIRMTITPTMINGGIKENVIPSDCTAVFDCRVLPGQSIAEAKTLILESLRDVGFDKLTFETIQSQEPTKSPIDTPLYETIRLVLGDIEPGCGVAPTLMVGGTDSRFFRRMGSVCYGFHPLRSESQYGVKATRREHGIDERISVENLVFGVSVLYETVKRFMT